MDITQSDIEIEPWNDSAEEVFFGPVTDQELETHKNCVKIQKENSSEMDLSDESQKILKADEDSSETSKIINDTDDSCKNENILTNFTISQQENSVPVTISDQLENFLTPNKHSTEINTRSFNHPVCEHEITGVIKINELKVESSTKDTYANSSISLQEETSDLLPASLVSEVNSFDESKTVLSADETHSSSFSSFITEPKIIEKLERELQGTDLHCNNGDMQAESSISLQHETSDILTASILSEGCDSGCGSVLSEGGSFFEKMQQNIDNQESIGVLSAYHEQEPVQNESCLSNFTIDTKSEKLKFLDHANLNQDILKIVDMKLEDGIVSAAEVEKELLPEIVIMRPSDDISTEELTGIDSIAEVSMLAEPLEADTNISGNEDRIFNDTIEDMEMLLKQGAAYFAENDMRKENMTKESNEEETFQSCVTSLPSPDPSSGAFPKDLEPDAELSRSLTYVVSKSKPVTESNSQEDSIPSNHNFPSFTTSLPRLIPKPFVAKESSSALPTKKEPKAPYNTPINKGPAKIFPGTCTPRSLTKTFERTKPSYPPKSYLTPHIPQRSKQSKQAFGSCKTLSARSRLPVVSPVAKYLQDNPPPPLITTTNPKFKISPKRMEMESRILQENLQTPRSTLAKKPLSETAPKTHQYVSGRLPLRTYTPTSVRIMNKENVPKSSRREIPTSTPQPSIIRHKGHMKIPKKIIENGDQLTESRYNPDVSLMDVSVLEVKPTIHGSTLNKK